MKKQATVHITKIAAAKRQLEAAMRMFFTREDELAIHTVAAAAFRVLRDIKGKRGSSFAADVLKEALYDFTRRYMEGTLRADEVEHLKAAGLLPFIISLVGRINSDGGKFDREQISVQMDFQAEQRMFPSAVANFLKHADRDIGAHLAFEEVKNLDLLIRATAAYLQLIKDRSPELTVFSAYWMVEENLAAGAEGELAAIAEHLKRLTPSRRYRSCSRLIKLMKKESQAN